MMNSIIIGYALSIYLIIAGILDQSTLYPIGSQITSTIGFVLFLVTLSRHVDQMHTDDNPDPKKLTETEP